MNSFEEFLKNKKQEGEKEKIDWPKRKDTWIKSIDDLYIKIEEWLEPFKNKGLLDVKKDKEVNLNEEYLGSYSVKRLDIYLGNDIISLIPKGTLILGSYGRIDMGGPQGEIMIIEPEWNDWKFAKRSPGLETWDVNEESFKSLIQELV